MYSRLLPENANPMHWRIALMRLAIWLKHILFNHYRAFRQAVLWAVCGMLHAAGWASWALLRPSWGYLEFGLSWEDFGATCVHVGASSSNISSDMESTYFVETPKSLLTCPWATKTFPCKNKDVIENGNHIPHRNADIAFARPLCS